MRFIAIILTITIGMVGAVEASAQNAKLYAQFTSTPITVDGVAETAWNSATPSNIAICMNPTLTTQLTDCQTSGTVQAVWNGPLLYLLFQVNDTNVTTSAAAVTNRSGVQIFVDQYDDKFPKFEEDDTTITVTAAGQQSGNATNAGLTIYPTAWSQHLKSYAAALTPTGYTIEIAWYIGDRPLVNDTKIGMDFAIFAASKTTNTNQYQLFWSSGANKGTDSNTMWGDVVLAGYDGASAMQLNTYMLNINVAKANALVRGVWKDETALNKALTDATNVQTTATTQAQIDTANLALDAALRGLRRTGKYPDPYDLPTVNNLPDPFTFFDGTKVKNLADWNKRSAEIIDLAQYYEFGYMPPAPKSLTAVSTSQTSGALAYKSIALTIQDNNRSASFTPVLYLPTTGQPPYPVIVEEDFASSPLFAPPNSAFLSGGYAVLSIPTSDFPSFGLPGVASDDGNHTGAFFKLYPYALDTAGDDRGVLLAWAWGASRGVDALQYLAANDPSYANLLNLNKLVVTGFSRYGKASLVAGLLDSRFLVTAPGGSGSGGAAPYRYDSFGNTPFRQAPFGNVYPWGTSPGAEAMGDHVRHQTHNSNEMIRRFLNDIVPAAVEPRMYKTDTWGYGGRMPFDHHEEIAAIAPRAVLIDNTNDDYADNAEGDAIGYEGAMPVYKFLGAPQNLALDLFMGGGGHSLKPSQAQNIVTFSNSVLFGTALDSATNTQLTTDPYLNAGTYTTYYGGFSTMMPWLTALPHANLLTGLSVSAGALSPAFSQDVTSYNFNVPSGVSITTVTATAEDPKAKITVNGLAIISGQASAGLPLTIGYNTLNIIVTSQDGVAKTYQVVINRNDLLTTTTLDSSNLSSNLNGSVTFTATVTASTSLNAPAGTVTFLDGGSVIGTGALTATSTTASKATYTTTALTAGTHTITATFPGALGFNSSSSAAITQIVTAPAYQAAFSPTTITIARGSSGTSTLTVKPIGGFTGTVTVGCGTPPSHMSCSFSTSTLTFTAASTASQTATITIGTTGMAGLQLPQSPDSTNSHRTMWAFALPCIGLVALFRRRSSGLRNMRLLAAILVCSAAAMLGILGCGDGGSKQAAAGTYTMNVNVTANNVTSNVPLTVTVQ
nr:sugar-binding protein [Granulicella sp. dw_53]